MQYCSDLVQGGERQCFWRQCTDVGTITFHHHITIRDVAVHSSFMYTKRY